MQSKEVSKIYETILSIPGMNDKVKISFQLPRTHIFLLSKIIDRGLSLKSADEKSGSVLDVMPKEIVQEISGLPNELLAKAGLTEMNQHLQGL